ncbi:hypothetical protein BP5796_00019 [Coleophoma crateriformis]|uniref:Transcription factor domain-containing protein n=1 Tax=Coleophoma crateriformis TaxID=565419 RepID=A0A3D8T6S3_9HELO|nr:hypothetical protein BP5796_00019 [Coleophoma crateriformis]
MRMRLMGSLALFFKQTTWNLERSDIQEAHLMQNYIANLSCFFDFVDPNCHFGRAIPERAKQSRLLSSAIYALSARHLSRTTKDFDPFTADRYYQACLRQLIPTTTNKNAIGDDTVLAATVILRFLEEMDIPLSGSDLKGHLYGTQAILHSQSQQQDQHTTHKPSALWQAASRAAFHQEVYNAISCHQPARGCAVAFASTGEHPADLDAAWTCRAVTHFGDVLGFVFGVQRGDIKRFAELVEENRAWQVERPASLDPYFARARQLDGEFNAFPDLRFLMIWHVMAPLYIILSHILLLLGDPHLPRMGIENQQKLRETDVSSTSLSPDALPPLWLRAAAKTTNSGIQSDIQTQDMVRSHVRTLCGISISNPHAPPASIVACMAISLCKYFLASFITTI